MVDPDEPRAALPVPLEQSPVAPDGYPPRDHHKPASGCLVVLLVLGVLVAFFHKQILILLLVFATTSSSSVGPDEAGRRRLPARRMDGHGPLGRTDAAGQVRRDRGPRPRHPRLHRE